MSFWITAWPRERPLAAALSVRLPAKPPPPMPSTFPFQFIGRRYTAPKHGEPGDADADAAIGKECHKKSRKTDYCAFHVLPSARSRRSHSLGDLFLRRSAA